MAKRSLVAQIAAMSEGAINKRLVGGEITQRALAGALSLKDRVERVVQGLAEVEDRVAVLERRVEALERDRKQPAPRRASTTKKPAAKAAPKTAAAKTATKTATKTSAAAAKPAAAKPPAKRTAS